MVPTKTIMAIPVAIFVVVSVLTHWTALRPRGEISTASATMCNQANGNETVVLPMGTSMNMLVSGCMRNAASRAIFNAITGTHLRLMRSPNASAPIVAGRKSRNMKTTGFPSAMAKNVPSIMLKLPMYGPSMIPYMGAMMSDNENAAPEAPIIGTVGISRSTTYRAVNIDMNAMIFVFAAFLIMLTNLSHFCSFFYVTV